MKIEQCIGCDYLAQPTYFKGVFNGVPQYEFLNNEEFCSCCFGIDGGAQLSLIGECPKVAREKVLSNESVPNNK